jgi:high-affinity nickel-transport protein
MVSFISIILLGFFLGMRHATDADHVIAVTTIISRQKSVARAAGTGVIWGLGHTITIFMVGVAIILFDWVIPPRLGLSMELSVGLMLVLLGVWNVRSFWRGLPEGANGALPDSARRHSHIHLGKMSGHSDREGSAGETKLASHEKDHDHAPLTILDRVFGGLAPYQVIRPLLVGIVHGLAGSAAITLLILTTIREPRWAIAYLLVFGVGTIAGMMLITMSIASAAHFVGRKQQRFSHALGLTCGLISLGFGIYLTYQIGILGGLFSSHPNWIPR